MSIIYDALKKTEKSINTNSNVETDSKGKPSKFKLKSYLLYVPVILVGLLIANMIFNYLALPKNTSQKRLKPLVVSKKPGYSLPQKKAEITPPKPQPQIEVLPKVALSAPLNVLNKPQAELVLNGVFFSQNEGYALINNQIVKEGDVIEGATVKRINLDNVELETAGKIVKLYANAK